MKISIWMNLVVVPLFFLIIVDVSAQAKLRGGIRSVDFLNFTYQSPLCSREISGIGSTVRIRNGQFQNSDVYYGVINNKIIYGDVTGDNIEEAIVPIACGELAANFGLYEIFIYTMRNGRTTMLARMHDKNIEQDYGRYYSRGELWAIINNGVKVTSGNLVVEKYAEGSHASPKYIVAFSYRLTGSNLTLTGKPQRRNVR